MFTDSSFNSAYPPQQVRVTDSTTSGSVPGGGSYNSMNVGASGDDRHWSADDSLFWISDSGAVLYVYGFSPPTMATGLLWDSLSYYGGANAFSQSNRNYLYNLSQTGILSRIDFSTGASGSPCTLGGSTCTPTVTTVYDFATDCQVHTNGNAFVAFGGLGGATGSPDAVFGGTWAINGQDYGYQAATYSPGTNTCYFYDTRFGTVHSYTGAPTATSGT